MYQIILYEDRHGRSDIEEYLKELRSASPSNKDARVNLERNVRSL